MQIWENFWIVIVFINTHCSIFTKQTAANRNGQWVATHAVSNTDSGSFYANDKIYQRKLILQNIFMNYFFLNKIYLKKLRVLLKTFWIYP